MAGFKIKDKNHNAINIAVGNTNDDNTITVHIPKDWEMKTAIELAMQISALYELKVNKKK